MKKIDWKIVDALRDDARKDLGDVADLLGVSTRTIQRRLSAMKEGKAIYLSASPKVGTVEGQMCCFLVFCPDQPKKRAVDSEIHSNVTRIGHSDFSSEDYSVFARHCENLAEADRVLEKLKAIDGVQNASMNVMQDMILVQDWLKNEIDRRISTQ